MCTYRKMQLMELFLFEFVDLLIEFVDLLIECEYIQNSDL